MQKYWPLIAVIALGVLALVLLNLGGRGERPKKLETEEVTVGGGAEAKSGDLVRVHYTGRLWRNNDKFDSSEDRGEPFAFTLGAGNVIRGWDEGVVGMKVGGKRKLTIPAALGYGSRPQPKIPADSDLVFDVELLAIIPRVTQLEKEDVKVGDGREAKSGNTVRVHYTGRLLSNGKTFDSSVGRGQPFEFPLGAGKVIRGWDLGVAGMKVGGKRKLKIPAALGYGERGSPGGIPPDADLEFDVELIEIAK